MKARQKPYIPHLGPMTRLNMQTFLQLWNLHWSLALLSLTLLLLMCRCHCFPREVMKALTLNQLPHQMTLILAVMTCHLLLSPP